MDKQVLVERVAQWHKAMRLTERARTAMSPPEKNMEKWDKISRIYDEDLIDDETRVNSVMEFLSQKGALTGDTVAIDIGCGTGSFAIGLAKRCREAYAFDLSSGMLDVVSRKAGEMGLSNIITVQGDWSSYDSFDPAITLALASLNPGIDNFDSLDKMNKVSSGWCCFIGGAGGLVDPTWEELRETVLGKALKKSHESDVIFPFNIIYAMGLKPEILYIPYGWSRLITKKQAVAAFVVDIGRFKDVDEDAMRTIEQYVDARLDENGKYRQGATATLGVMVWKAPNSLQ